MAVAHRTSRPAYPLFAILLAGSVPLFLGVLFSDMAYSSSYEVQWKNFASWLLVGALVCSGLAMLWMAIDLFRGERRGRQWSLALLLLLIAWVAGFVNALIHAKDAWASMPDATILSVIAAALALAATWAALSDRAFGDRR